MSTSRLEKTNDLNVTKYLEELKPPFRSSWNCVDLVTIFLHRLQTTLQQHDTYKYASYLYGDNQYGVRTLIVVGTTQ